MYLCDWFVDGRSLSLSCSEIVAQKLTEYCDVIALKYEHIEKIVINGTVVFEQTVSVKTEPSSISAIYSCAEELTELSLPVLSEGMKVTPELMKILFPEKISDCVP
jgi:hypothetical protein